ncbi:MAG: calcium/sodium antiporter [Fibrobacteraceae bacterium]|nr:calcium/sodium antiporter [Fibrobacteraceae bacterium]
MFLPILSFILGLVLLIWSAGRFVVGASALAKYCGLSSFLIGMIVVGFGTSAPELAVSLFAALGGSPELALGNAYGSNIGNIALILGFTAIIFPIVIPKSAIRMDIPLLLLATAISFVLLFFNKDVSRLDGILLVLLFAVIIALQIWQGISNKAENSDNETGSKNLLSSLFWLVLGLGILVGSSKLLVFGATEIAKALGVSDLLIGLTVVAIGTSLPELASSVIAAKKGDTALALGNIVGSNIFNSLIVVGISAIISPMNVDSLILQRDLPVTAFLTLLLLLFGIHLKNEPKIGRVKGIFLFLFYIVYTVYLFCSA